MTTTRDPRTSRTPRDPGEDRNPRDPRDDRGAGAVLAIALVTAVVVVGLAGVSLSSALTARQRVIGAADLAALAAADAASGAIGGVPCELAADVARANGARVAGCEADGLLVTVTVVGSFAGIPIEARSTAGPPPWGRREDGRPMAQSLPFGGPKPVFAGDVAQSDARRTGSVGPSRLRAGLCMVCLGRKGRSARDQEAGDRRVTGEGQDHRAVPR